MLSSKPMRLPRVALLTLSCALSLISPVAHAEGDGDDDLEGDGASTPAERWCAPELEVLSTGACFKAASKPAAGPSTLVIFLHGVIKPESGWQATQQRAAARAAEAHGFTVMMPPGRRGNGPQGMTDWHTWPTASRHAALESELLSEWAKGRVELEARLGKRFERVWIFGFSNGAYFATSLALRGRLGAGAPVEADGFAVFAGGDGAAYLEKAARQQKQRAKVFVGWGKKDKAHRDQKRLAGLLTRLRWPSKSAEAARAGHTMVDAHVTAAVRFLSGH